MTQVLLCAGPNLLVVRKDGLLFFRRPGQPDTPVPYAPAHYPVFLHSAQHKHGLTPVLGPSDEEAPCLAEESAVLALHRERLPSGDVVYRLGTGTIAPAVKPQDSRTPCPSGEEKAAHVTN